MEEAIVNRVEKSGVVQLDLGQWYTHPKKQVVRIMDWVHPDPILREKPFREALAATDWEKYREVWVAVEGTEDSIIPTWAFMLLAKYLADVDSRVVFGSRVELEMNIWKEIFNQMDWKDYQDKKVIVKGCGSLFIPEGVYADLTARLMPCVRSLMFGEPCSTVPVYKKRG
ncbi:MAG TPA: hypothetical protein DDX92_00025 [Flavobacteriales bacterium]|jgi:hypothetical protein|nr:hypothetical protein [Flavobacteriales bacterium]